MLGVTPRNASITRQGCDCIPIHQPGRVKVLRRARRDRAPYDVWAWMSSQDRMIHNSATCQIESVIDVHPELRGLE